MYVLTSPIVCESRVGGRRRTFFIFLSLYTHSLTHSLTHTHNGEEECLLTRDPLEKLSI